jgi:hypothetical protein
VNEALKATTVIEDEFYRSRALVEVIPLLPTNLLADSLVSTRRIEEPSYRAIALAALARRMPGLVPEVVELLTMPRRGY